MFTYDGFDFSEYLLVNNIGRPLLPKQKPVTKKVTGQNKALFVRTEFEPVTIPVDVTIYQDGNMNYQEMKRFLAGKLYRTEPRPLSFYDEPDIEYFAVMEKETEIDDLLESGTATLNFYCPDPVAYGKERSFDISESPEVYYAGTYPTKGHIRIEIGRSANELTVTLENTGEYLKIENSDFAVGDIVDIDFDSEYISKNGISIMDNLVLDSDFFEIPVGAFRVLVSNGVTTLTYRERWV